MTSETFEKYLNDNCKFSLQEYMDMCNNLQSKKWDHKLSLYDLLQHSSSVFLVQKGYHNIPAEYNVYTGGFTVMIQDETNMTHYTEIPLYEDGFYYRSDLYMYEKTINAYKYQVWTKSNPIEIIKLAIKYKIANVAVHELEQALRDTQNTEMRNNVDIVFGFGHLH